MENMESEENGHWYSIGETVYHRRSGQWAVVTANYELAGKRYCQILINGSLYRAEEGLLMSVKEVESLVKVALPQESSLPQGWVVPFWQSAGVLQFNCDDRRVYLTRGMIAKIMKDGEEVLKWWSRQ